MELGDIIELSRFYGRGTDFVIAGGGNTSVKDRDRMAIKASGFALGDIGESGFVELFRPAVRAILGARYSTDPSGAKQRSRPTSTRAGRSPTRADARRWRPPCTRCWSGGWSCTPIRTPSTR